MSKLGWGKKKITDNIIKKWYKDQPIGKMVKYMQEKHRLLAAEQGGGIHRDSILVYDRCKFMKALNLSEPDIQSNPAETHIELSTAVEIWEKSLNKNQPTLFDNFVS